MTIVCLDIDDMDLSEIKDDNYLYLRVNEFITNKEYNI